MIKATYRKVHWSLQFWGVRALDERGGKEGSEQVGTVLEQQLRACACLETTTICQRELRNSMDF